MSRVRDRSAVAASMDRAAAHDRAPARERAAAEGQERRIAHRDRDPVDLRPQRLRRDLSEGRRLPLALRAHSGADEHVAGRVDADPRGFEVDHAGDIDTAGNPPGEPRAVGPGLHGLAIAALLDRPVEQRWKVAAKEVETDAAETGCRRVGQVVRPDQVAPPEPGRVDIERAGGAVDQGLDGERGFRLPGAAIGRCGRLVGADRQHLDGEVGDAVGAGDQGAAQLARGDAAGEHIGAGIERNRGPQRFETPVLGEPEFERHVDPARMGRRQHVLAPVLDPLDRAAEPTARLRENDLLAIAARLGAEPAADILADHPEPRSRAGRAERRGFRGRCNAPGWRAGRSASRAPGRNRPPRLGSPTAAEPAARSGSRG